MTRLALLLCVTCFFVVAARGQNAADTFATGSWMGAITMGDTHPRLLFHIATDSAGRLTGTVGSPDKGVKGIPLSRVHVSGDSIAIEVSAALASFDGVFSADKQTIEGIWKEGDTSYSLTLKRVTDAAEYSTPIGKKARPLGFQLASQHFAFYSHDSDRVVLDDLALTLEANYSRITDHMHTAFAEKINVYIYPNVDAFHKAISLPDAPNWIVGAAGKNELQIVSPLNPGSAHSYSSLVQAVVHEFTHTVVLNVREQGQAGLPKWLNEGYAFYEAKQVTDAMRKSIASNARKEPPPSWNRLAQAGTVEFGDMDGYALSATIIEFLVNSHGFDKLRQLILAPDKMADIYGVSPEDLEEGWGKYLRTL